MDLRTLDLIINTFIIIIVFISVIVNTKTSLKLCHDLIFVKKKPCDDAKKQEKKNRFIYVIGNI